MGNISDGNFRPEAAAAPSFNVLAGIKYYLTPKMFRSLNISTTSPTSASLAVQRHRRLPRQSVHVPVSPSTSAADRFPGLESSFFSRVLLSHPKAVTSGQPTGATCPMGTVTSQNAVALNPMMTPRQTCYLSIDLEDYKHATMFDMKLRRARTPTRPERSASSPCYA